MFNEIFSGYRSWICHRESAVVSSSVNLRGANSSQNFRFEDDEDDIVGMLNDVSEELVKLHDQFERLLGDVEKPLYVGCANNFTKFLVIVRLYNLKARNGWSDKSFLELLKVIAEMLPQPNKLPTSMYEVKKAMPSLGIWYEKILACRNDCILYRKKYINLWCCPVCGVVRWKLEKNKDTNKKRVPAKVLLYIPPIPRFRRLFQNVSHAKSLTWNVNGRINDSMLYHLADVSQWKTIDILYPEFGKKARNLHLGLSTDGMNPHTLQTH